MNKLLPATLILGCVALIAIAFIFPVVQNNQFAAVASNNTAGFTFRTKTLQVEEGDFLKVTVVAPQNLNKTTRVAVQVLPGTAKSGSDIQAVTKYVTFYEGGLTAKTVSIKTNTDRTVEQPETFSLKIGGTSEVASVTLYEKGTNPNDTGNVIVGTATTTTTTTGTATTAPTNCAQYAGVIPGGQKFSVQTRNFSKMVINTKYGFSAQAQQELDSMQDSNGVDIGRGEMRMGGPIMRVLIPSGVVLSYPFKTSEYNFPIMHDIGNSAHPGSGEGFVVYSVSEGCAGDFTSPALLAKGYSGQPVDESQLQEKFPEWGPLASQFGGRGCVSIGSQIAGKMVFSYGSGFARGAGGCQLEPNKKYYLNIAVSSLSKASDFGSGVSVDVLDYANVFKPTQVPNQMWDDVVKNKDAYYAEMKKIGGLFSAEAQQRGAQCRNAITQYMAQNGGARMPTYTVNAAGQQVQTGGECGGIRMPESMISWQ